MEFSRRLSGFAGLAFAAVLVAGFVLDGMIAVTTGGPPQLYASSISADLTRSGGSVVWRVELWVYIASLIPFVMFLPGLRASLASHERLAAELGTVMALLFIVLHTVHNLAYAAIVTGLAPSYVAGTAQSVATEQVARGLIALAEAAFLPGGGIGAALLAIALGTFGMTQRRAGSRLGVVAIAAAVLTGLGYVGLFVGQPALVLGLGGWVVFIVWTAMTSLSLIHETAPMSATSATRPAPAY